MAAENFPVASLLVRRELRPLMRAFYAFARQADDVADYPRLSSEAKLARLTSFERGLDGAPGGEPAGLQLHRLLAAHGRMAAAEHARALLEAFRLDARKDRHRTWTELRGYCRLSADPVGRFILEIHDEAPDTHPPADALCTALQVLNHLQDLREDYLHLDRVYLPLVWLETAGGREVDLCANTATPALREAMDQALHETAGLLAQASLLPGRLRSRRLAAEVAMILSLAAHLQRRLEREDPLARRVAPRRLDFARGAVRGAVQLMTPPRRMPLLRRLGGSA